MFYISICDTVWAKFSWIMRLQLEFCFVLFLPVDVQLLQHHVLERLSFLKWIPLHLYQKSAGPCHCGWGDGLLWCLWVGGWPRYCPGGNEGLVPILAFPETPIPAEGLGHLDIGWQWWKSIFTTWNLPPWGFWRRMGWKSKCLCICSACICFRISAQHGSDITRHTWAAKLLPLDSSLHSPPL